MVVVAAACASSAGPGSFDPATPCTADGRMVGAYPDLERLLPTMYHGAAPDTVDSGRNCTSDSLGSLATAGIKELRFAGATWTFGAERAVVIAVFTAPGLTADAVAEFYTAGAMANSRTTISGQDTPTIAGRAGHRLDTQTSDRLQTVVVWPSAVADRVNVVITNDLPEERIQEAVTDVGAG